MPRTLRTPLYLRTVGRQQTTAASPSKYPTHVTLKLGGKSKRVPVSYFWKDAISVGDYKHPLTGQAFSVDRVRIDGWVDKFRRMRAAGVEVPTPVDHSDSAEDNRGFVVDARREGGTLKLLHQAIGKDAAIVAARNRCSVYIDPDFRDGSGKRWGEVIAHSAYTPKPVVHGHGAFVPFAASRAAGRRTVKVPAFYLAATKEPTTMPATLKAAVSLLNKKERVRLRQLLKLDAGAKIKSDEVAGELLDLSPKRRTAALAILDKAKARAAKAKADAAEGDDEGDEDDEGSDDDDDADEDEDLDDDDDTVDEEDDDEAEDDDDEEGEDKPAGRRRREAVAASRAAKVDPHTAALMASSYRSECEAAVRSGRVTPETIDSLNKLLTDRKGRPNALALSMAPGTDDPFAFRLMRVLRRNKAVPMAGGGNGRTQSQAFAAARTVPGSKKDREAQREIKQLRKETEQFAAKRNGKKQVTAKTE